MPFTLAHAAALFPFRRMRFITSAFVVGSFAPDFLYFLQLAPRSRYGHGWPGMVTFSLPAALVVLWLFHAVMKRPAAEFLPDGWQTRLEPLLGALDLAGHGVSSPSRWAPLRAS